MIFTLIPPEHSEADTMRDCPICLGTGGGIELALVIILGQEVEQSYYQSCPECGGSGKISRDRGARSSLD